MFKATEMAQLLMYTAPVLFSNRACVDPAILMHIILLFCGLRLLADPQKASDRQNLVSAADCLESFIAEGVRLFGRNFNVFSVHGLAHLTGEVEDHGALYSFSAFKAENYFGPLMREIRYSGDFTGGEEGEAVGEEYRSHLEIQRKVN
jgi:hypothetical protein